MSESDKKTTEQIITLLVGLLLLSVIAQALLSYINSLNIGDLFDRILSYFLEHIWPIWKWVAAILSALAVVGISYNLYKLNIINKEEQPIFNPSKESVSKAEVSEPKNERWEKVLKLMNSNSESDWKQAIIEADVMLEELMRTLGYPGESVGDMLKVANKNEFITIDDAWEAHKVRNAIAHSGGNFQINERETKRVIALFEKVFKEFDLI